VYVLAYEQTGVCSNTEFVHIVPTCMGALRLIQCVQDKEGHCGYVYVSTNFRKTQSCITTKLSLKQFCLNCWWYTLVLFPHILTTYYLANISDCNILLLATLGETITIHPGPVWPTAGPK